MSFNDQASLVIQGRALEFRDQGDLRIGLNTGQVVIISPTPGQSDFTVGSAYQWAQLNSYEYYKVETAESNTFSTLNENKIVKATQLLSTLAASTGYWIRVTAMQIRGQAQDAITGVSITPSTATVTEGESLILTGSIQGNGTFDSTGTWSRTTGAVSFTTNGNEITISPTAGTSGAQSTFVFTPNGETNLTAQRTITVLEASANDPNIDSLQGDFDALQALYNSTQGNGIEELTKVSLSGTISTSSSSSTVTGSGTSFTSEISVGDKLWYYSGEQLRAIGTVSSIGSNSSLALSGNAENGVSGVDFVRINNLPTRTNATYPFMYIINDEIHALSKERLRGIGEWVNHGAIWKNKTGWINMTPETMGDAVGVTTDVNGRVTILDMQKVTEISAPSGGFLTNGNGLIGTLPSEIGNLKKMQWFNLKQNFFHGDIPDVFSGWADLERWSVGGQYWEINLDNRILWHESDHTFASTDDNPFTQSSSGVGKKIVATNNFRSKLPSSLDGLQNLELIEAAHQYLLGPLPAWSDMPSIKGIYIPDIRGPENLTLGEIPTSWGNLNNIQLFNIGNYSTYSRYTGQLPTAMQNWTNLANFAISDNDFTGGFPQFTGFTDLVYFVPARCNFTGLFPWDSIFNGSNSRLSKFSIGNNSFTGPLPETIPQATSPSNTYPNYRLDAFTIQGNNFDGPIPAWVTEIEGVQIYNFDENSFTQSLPSGFNNNNSNMYRDLRVIRLQNTGVSGSLPKSVFNNTDYEGSVTSNSGTTVNIDIDLSPLITGTITDSSSSWIRNLGASHQQEWADVTEVTIIVPDGENIVFTPIMYADNTSYLWSPSSVDTSGTNGYDYEVRPKVSGTTFLAKSGDQGIVREVTGSTTNSIIVDEAIADDLTGYTWSIHRPSNQLLYVYMNSNEFSGRIPIEWSAIRTERTGELEILATNQNLSGYVDPGLALIPGLKKLNISGNQFTASDLEDIIASAPQGLDFQYGNQNPI